jgi:hypothetical protein
MGCCCRLLCFRLKHSLRSLRAGASSKCMALIWSGSSRLAKGLVSATEWYGSYHASCRDSPWYVRYGAASTGAAMNQHSSSMSSNSSPAMPWHAMPCHAMALQWRTDKQTNKTIMHQP